MDSLFTNVNLDKLRNAAEDAVSAPTPPFVSDDPTVIPGDKYNSDLSDATPQTDQTMGERV